MIINTAAEGISFSRKLENDSAAFYEAEARVYHQFSEALMTFARENKKFIAQIEQTYYQAITDAIEGCFALDLETDDYIPDMGNKTSVRKYAFIEQAVRMEEVIQQFYLKAGEQSKSLMADVSRSFIMTARKHKARLTQLAGLQSA